jgi:diguanylate cyclase (GGDEF)-like protein
MKDTIVSIRQTMDHLDQREQLLETALACYAASIGDVDLRVVRHCQDRHAPEGEEPSADLARLCQALTFSAHPAALEGARQRLSAVLERCETHILRWVGGGANISEVLTTLEETAGALRDGTERQQTRLRGVAGSIAQTAILDDVHAIRAELRSQARQVEAVAEELSVDMRKTIQHLEGEILSYRTRLAQAEVEAATDALTGLANRRHLERTIQAWIEENRPFSLVLVDLDRFKLVNDVHGHLAGDDVLRTFGARLKGRLTEADMAGRWGGDEFLVLLSCSISDAMARVRQWQSILCGRYTLGRDRGSLRLEVGASFGVAERKAGESAQQLFGRADKLLYREKPPAA